MITPFESPNRRWKPVCITTPPPIVPREPAPLTTIVMPLLPSSVKEVPTGTVRSEPVPLPMVSVRAALACRVTKTPLVRCKAPRVCVGTLVTVGAGVMVPLKNRMSLVAGNSRAGDQFNGICQSEFTVPTQVYEGVAVIVIGTFTG